MEADKTLSLGITVSDITTVFRTHDVAMPVCKYEEDQTENRCCSLWLASTFTTNGHVLLNPVSL
ncbi:unnamed protein product [Gongylonema pulchrum]|uniref:CBS domain-containing protein n=1 Tax=Gongylonema pulchrum TaxID=637853 RepID=A0A183E2F8_9BILA|nr:unnamed protein product [Gongylonema pulchrum]